MRDGRPLRRRSGWLTTKPSRSRLVRCWRTALGVTPRSEEIVSALAWPLRRSNSRTSIRVERPAMVVGISGRFGDVSRAPGYLLQVDLDKIPTIRKLKCQRGLSMINLADQRQMPPVLSVAINKVIEESPEVTVLAQAKPASVMEAMDALYEIQDSLMYNQIEDE